MMLRLGAPSDQTREMDLDDIFLFRLQLMIIMAKSFLGGCPMGEPRRQAMLDNACHVETESIDLGRSFTEDDFRRSQVENTEHDHLFYQRVKLLAVMVKAAAKGFPISDHRKSAMKENLDIICKTLSFCDKLETDAAPRVA